MPFKETIDMAPNRGEGTVKSQLEMGSIFLALEKYAPKLPPPKRSRIKKPNSSYDKPSFIQEKKELTLPTGS